MIKAFHQTTVVGWHGILKREYILPRTELDYKSEVGISEVPSIFGRSTAMGNDLEAKHIFFYPNMPIITTPIRSQDMALPIPRYGFIYLVEYLIHELNGVCRFSWGNALQQIIWGVLENYPFNLLQNTIEEKRRYIEDHFYSRIIRDENPAINDEELFYEVMKKEIVSHRYRQLLRKEVRENMEGTGIERMCLLIEKEYEDFIAYMDCEIPSLDEYFEANDRYMNIFAIEERIDDIWNKLASPISQTDGMKMLEYHNPILNNDRFQGMEILVSEQVPLDRAIGGLHKGTEYIFRDKASLTAWRYLTKMDHRDLQREWRERTEGVNWESPLVHKK